MRLFVYGELCKPPVLFEVLGRVPPAEPAILFGFRREFSPATGYYRACPKEGSLMTGLLLTDIDGADLPTLDSYENVAGGEYRRLEVEVRPLDAAVSVHAYAYAAAP